MDKELIFKEIRRGQVLIWAGAGFSRYAGYPMGPGVVQRLYNELTTEQRQQLADSLGQLQPECPNMPLPEFAQQFVNLHYGSRERLVEVVTELFSAAPSSRATHDQLAAIAYIDYIVTTNYDPLFELVYGPATLHTVTHGDNVPQIGRKPVTLFKIHGDLSQPRTLIITRDDYTRFFEKADELVWTQLKGLMGTRTIVFIGYAVEDPNVLDVFLSLVDKLGVLMRPAFVVGPSMIPLRIEELRRKNIHFIQSTGEDFVNDFVADMKKKALTELQSGGSKFMTPVSQTLMNLGFDFTLRPDGTGFLTENLRLKNGPTQNQFNFSFASEELAQNIISLEKGETLKAIKISGNKVQDFSHTVEGFVLPKPDVVNLWIARAPGWEGKGDVRFDSGLFIPQVEIMVYGHPGRLNVVALSATARVEIVLDVKGKTTRFNDMSIHLSRRPDFYPNCATLIEHVRIMRALATADPFDIIQKGKIIWRRIGRVRTGTDKKNSLLKESDFLMPLTEMLLVIERHFGIVFQNFTLQGQSTDDIIQLYKILSQEKHLVNENRKLTLTLFDKSEENMKLLNTKGVISQSIVIEGTYSPVYEVLGWQLQVDCRLKDTVLNPVSKKLKAADKYQVKSQSNQFLRECLKINHCVVVHEPEWQENPAISAEQQIEERHPKY